MRLTETEWQVMNALWLGWPVTARQIAERLPKDVNWAYTTIKTILTRLVKKGAVAESKDGNVAYYKPILSRENARHNALKSLVNQAFDGAFGPLMHFLVEDGKLSDKQKAELRRALEEEDKQEGESK